MSFLNFDSPFMGILTKILDSIYLSVLWLIFSLPVITLGASTTALYYSANKALNNDRGYIFQQFFKAFKSNFKQSTQAFLIFLAAFLLLNADIIILEAYDQHPSLVYSLTVLFKSLIFIEAFFAFYVFAYIGRFSSPLRRIFKNVLLISIANLPRTILMGIILTIGGLIVWIIPMSILLVPALAAWLVSAVLEKIYARYTPL